MARPLFLVGISFLLFSVILAGCPNCPYESRCAGQVIKFCSVGIDQIVGSPSWSERECLSPNPVCVDLDPRNALCAIDRQLTCTDAFVPVCGDGVVISCVNGYQVAEDCAVDGNVCANIDQEPRCALEPVTACDHNLYTEHCDGQKVIRCDRMLVRAEDCAAKVPPQTCKEYQSSYGRSAYCSTQTM